MWGNARQDYRESAATFLRALRSTPWVNIFRRSGWFDAAFNFASLMDILRIRATGNLSSHCKCRADFIQALLFKLRDLESWSYETR